LTYKIHYRYADTPSEYLGQGQESRSLGQGEGHISVTEPVVCLRLKSNIVHSCDWLLQLLLTEFTQFFVCVVVKRQGLRSLYRWLNRLYTCMCFSNLNHQTHNSYTIPIWEHYFYRLYCRPIALVLLFDYPVTMSTR